MTSTIHKTTSHGSFVRVVFSHFDDQGKEHGPFMEDRPSGSDWGTWVADQAAAHEATISEPRPTEVERLRTELLQYPDATIKEALAITDEKLAELKDSKAWAEAVEERP